MGDTDKRETKKKISLMKDRDENSGGNGAGDKEYGQMNQKSDARQYQSAHILSEMSSHSQPTIILKTRDGETRALSPNQSHNIPIASPYASRGKKEIESYGVTSIAVAPTAAIKPKNVLTKVTNAGNGLTTAPCMTASMPLIEENHFTGDGILDFLTENNEFLVVGCIGTQGVGKSTIMSKLSETHDRKGIFKVQSEHHVLTSSHCTSSIDLYVSENRIFFLDTPPLLSPSLMEKLIYMHDSKKSFSTNVAQSFGSSGSSGGSGGNIGGGSQITSGDFASIENALEITSLQITAFLLSVCHVVILVQDWFYDPNILRFLHTAEMLKPPMLTTSPRSEEITEYFPHIIFVQNKAKYSDFTRNNLSVTQAAYSQSFLRSRLQIQSGIGIASGNVIRNLNVAAEGSSDSDPLNLYLLPDIDIEKREDSINGHPGFDYLMEKLKRDLFGIAKNPLTHQPLPEKNWFHYSSKVWEAVKSSSFFHEYDRLFSKFE